MTPQEKLETYMGRVSEAIKAEHPSLSSDLDYVFTTITEDNRRYLAIWGYLLFPSLGFGSMEDSWPQTDTHIAADVDQAVDKVIARWVAPEPKYSLDTNREPRTLHQQVGYWNGNRTVRALGDELLTKLLTAITPYPDTPEDKSLKKYRKYLENVELSSSPTSATPGLSRHGTGRAFDFIVYKSGQPITDTSTTKASIDAWDGGPDKWTQRLKDAVTAANQEIGTGRFDGPLNRGGIYEPWHYDFFKNQQ
jgi:hypothetical protein